MDPIGIRTRPLADILARLRAPVPPELIEQTRKPGGTVDTINVWVAHDLMDFRAPGWSEVTTITPTPRGDLGIVVAITIVGSDGELTRTGAANGDPNDTDDPKQPGDAVTNGFGAAFKRATSALGLGRQLWLKDRPRAWNLDWDTPVKYPGDAAPSVAIPADPLPSPSVAGPAGGTPFVGPTKALDQIVPDLFEVGDDEAVDFRAMFDMAAGDPYVQATIAQGARDAVDKLRAVRDAAANPPPVSPPGLAFDPASPLSRAAIDAGAERLRDVLATGTVADVDAALTDGFGPAPWDAPPPAPAIDLDDPAALDPPGPLGVVDVAGKSVDPATGLIVGTARRPYVAPAVPPGTKSTEWEPKLAVLTTPEQVDAWRPEITDWARGDANTRHADAVWRIFWKHKARVLKLAIEAARSTDDLAYLKDQIEAVPLAAGGHELKSLARDAWTSVTTPV